MRTTQAATQGTTASSPWLHLIREPPSRTSGSLGWRHIEAHRFDGVRCWNLQLPALPQHLITAHLFKPCHVDTRWGGRTRRAHSQPGNAMLMSAGQDSVWNCSDSIDELLVFLDPVIVDEVAEEIGGRRFELLDGVAIVEPAIREICMQLLAEIENPGMGTRLFADTMSRALALQLLRRRSTARKIDTPRQVSMTARQLRAATDFIEAHLEQDLSLDSLSGATAMSPYRFARAFKTAAGRSPRQYVIARRIERAKELLRAYHDIAEVAQRVGFATHSHFTAAFHRYCGTTPKRFRDSCRS